MRRINLLLAALAALPLSLHAVPAAAQTARRRRIRRRHRRNHHHNARFAEASRDPAVHHGLAISTGGRRGRGEAEFDDSAWTSVTLPHDWSIAGPVKEDAPSRGAGGFAPTGIGWYRKTFTVPAADAKPSAARRTFVVFDGVMANSDVYLNGELLGHRPYGYVSFTYELTPHLQAGKNVIAVKVDDSQQPASRWYPGAGINRQVRLITTGDAHIVPWGTFVTTPTVTAESATIHIRSTVTNESATEAKLSLRVRLPDRAAAPFFRQSATRATLILAPGDTADMDAETTLPKPDRWDLDHPAMYTVHATLLRDGKPVDEEVVPFGIREFHFDADQGFFLNGVHHKVLGVALHTDGGAVGTAVPLAVWERRLTELRKLGVNAIRTAHNPPAPEFLDLADRMGFLIMDEMFDCWTVAKNPYDYHLYFKEWNIRDTTDTVMRDRNHPSIILWSAGNEIHDTPKPEVAIPILKALVETFHQNDPTRPVTQALFRPNASHDYEDGLADLLDVVGQDYRPRRYWQPMRRSRRARSLARRTATNAGIERRCATTRSTPGSFCGVGSTTLASRAAGPPSAPAPACCCPPRCRTNAPSSARAGGPPLRWWPWSAHLRRPRRPHRSWLRERNQHRPVRGSRSTTRRQTAGPRSRVAPRPGCCRGALLAASAGGLDPEEPRSPHGKCGGVYQRRRG